MSAYDADHAKDKSILWTLEYFCRRGFEFVPNKSNIDHQVK